ncbi:MAG: DUF3786 domain-containing protein [Desulfopila sp.]
MTELLSPSHFQNLAALSPQEVCQRTGCQYEPAARMYRMSIWDACCDIYPEAARFDWGPGPTLHEYFQLVALHYLLLARDTHPSGEWISEKDMPGGATFFRGPHAVPGDLITRRVANSVDTFKRLCEMRGGMPLAMADAGYRFTVTDRVEVAVLYWAGDDDFAAESKLLFDRTITDHFALDIVFALAVGFCQEIIKS